MAWSAERKYPLILILKKSLPESMLTQHCISHTY